MPFPSARSPVRGRIVIRIAQQSSRRVEGRFLGHGHHDCLPAIRTSRRAADQPSESKITISAAIATSASRKPVEESAESSNRSEEHTSELQSLMRTSYAVLCLNKNNKTNISHTPYRYKRKNRDHKTTHKQHINSR